MAFDLIDAPVIGNVIPFPRAHRAPAAQRPRPIEAARNRVLAEAASAASGRTLREQACDAAALAVFALFAGWNAALLLTAFGVRLL